MRRSVCAGSSCASEDCCGFAHPGSERLHREKIERNAKKGEHARGFDCQGNVGSGQFHHAAEEHAGEWSTLGSVRGESRLGPPEHCQAMAEVKAQRLKRTEQCVKREERVGQIKRVPDTRTKERSLDQIPGDSAESCEGGIH